MKDKCHLFRYIVIGAIGVSLAFTACSRPTANGNTGGSNTTPVPVNASDSGSSSSGTDTVKDAQADQKEPSVVAISAGAYIVQRPNEWMESESAYALLDENPRSKWATARGVTSPQTIVIALPEKTSITALEFDNGNVDSQFTGCGAKDVTVEVSDTNERDGFKTIADVSLKDVTNDQRFPVTVDMAGRWVRLTVKNNHSSEADNTIELSEFRAYGKRLSETPVSNISGTYNFQFTGGLHLRQEGTSVTGCYESRSGLVKGGIEGHAVKFTWYEMSGYNVQEMGSGVMIFPPDGKQAIGVWWEKAAPANSERILVGEKKSPDVGTCPQWAGGAEEQMARDLAETGRARVYGINFDTDSDKIRDESKPTLDKIVRILKSKPDLSITVEGHTDSTSTPQHNQDLSERRAASVKAYLVAAGIDAGRLRTSGFGATKPVASNENELGRAQNRRVELAKL